MSHLSATIISLSQDMDLSEGSMANFMFLRLSDGTVVRALIGDDAAQDIIRLSVGQNGATIPAPPLVMPDVDAAHVFGGAEPPPAAPEEEADPPPPPPRAPRRRPKRVDKDELGYPVVHMDGGIDPSELTGGKDRDEDGIGQV